jgi:hypothetical protein
MSLLISKSTAKNFADADLEINNKKKKLYRCRFKNRQLKTMSLPIQKLATMVESFRLYFFFFLVFTDKDCSNHKTKDQIIKGARL